MRGLKAKISYVRSNRRRSPGLTTRNAEWLTSRALEDLSDQICPYQQSRPAYEVPLYLLREQRDVCRSGFQAKRE